MKVLEVLLNNRWILKSRDRELYYQAVSYTHLTLPTT